MSGGPRITPQSRIGELLAAYPQLEEVLIERSAVFAKLRNPVLRRTVARVATVEKVAAVAGIEVRELVTLLRRAVGQPVDESDTQGGGTAAQPAAARPAWTDEGTIAETIDADAMLAAGEVPLGRVVARSRELAPGQLLRVLSSFRPAPLLDALERSGARVDCARRADGMFETFVAPAERSGSPAR
jgi:hypothetical protein